MSLTTSASESALVGPDHNSDKADALSDASDLKTTPPEKMTPEGSPETDQLTLTFNEAADLPKTMLLFQPDAYLALFPYCQAILSSNKVLDKDDKIESIGMCVSAMIVAELDAIAASPGQEYRRQTAKATLQLVSSAAQKKNPYLIRESCAYVKDLRHPMGTSLKNERIYEIAQVLESRGFESNSSHKFLSLVVNNLITAPSHVDGLLSICENLLHYEI